MKERRTTKQKELIRTCVTEHKNHPTADEIYLAVRARDAKISRGTVYRNLNSMALEGELMQVKLPGADRFDFNNSDHYHIICSVCGRVEDVFSVPYREENDLLAEQEMCFKSISHQTFFEGICPECKNRKEVENNE